MIWPFVAFIAGAGADLIAPGAELKVLGEGYTFTEGPAADDRGNVYFTDQPNDRIMKWSVDGAVTEWMKPCGRSNGMRFDHHGNIISCADDNNQLWAIAPDKSHQVLVKDFEGKLLNGPNDVWIRPDGGMYFTDPLYERNYWKRDPAIQQPGHYVFFLSADHKVLKPVATDLVKPNGIIGTPDGKTLYVADIRGGQTFRYSIEKDGTLSNKTLHCSMGSDGMTLDEQGNLYITGQGVHVFSKTGEKILHIDIKEPWTANITFAGKDHKMLFITASTRVYGLQMNVRGASRSIPAKD